jgi:hypothetical protein
LGDYQQARALDEDTLTRFRRVLGADHPNTLGSASDLAADLAALGDYHQARSLHEDTLTAPDGSCARTTPHPTVGGQSCGGHAAAGRYRAAVTQD